MKETLTIAIDPLNLGITHSRAKSQTIEGRDGKVSIGNNFYDPNKKQLILSLQEAKALELYLKSLFTQDDGKPDSNFEILGKGTLWGTYKTQLRMRDFLEDFQRKGLNFDDIVTIKKINSDSSFSFPLSLDWFALALICSGGGATGRKDVWQARRYLENVLAPHSGKIWSGDSLKAEPKPKAAVSTSTAASAAAPATSASPPSPAMLHAKQNEDKKKSEQDAKANVGAETSSETPKKKGWWGWFGY